MALSSKDLNSLKIGDYIYFKGSPRNGFSYGKAYRVVTKDKDTGKIVINDNNNVFIKIDIETSEDFIFHVKKSTLSIGKSCGRKFWIFVAVNFILSLLVKDELFYSGNIFTFVITFIGFSLITGSIVLFAIVAIEGESSGRKTSNKSKNYITSKPKEIRCPKCGSNQISANKRGFSAKGAVVGGVIGGFIGSNKVIVTCIYCGHSWKAGKQ